MRSNAWRLGIALVRALLPILALPLVAACADAPTEWPVCAEEPEMTAETYAGYGTLAQQDFLVCGPLPADGAPCPERHEVDGNALFAENVGADGDGRCAYRFDVECGPETTRTEACCYVLGWDGAVWCR